VCGKYVVPRGYCKKNVELEGTRGQEGETTTLKAFTIGLKKGFLRGLAYVTEVLGKDLQRDYTGGLGRMLKPSIVVKCCDWGGSNESSEVWVGRGGNHIK